MFECSSEGQNACVILAEPAFLGKLGIFRGFLGEDSPPSSIYALRGELTRMTVPALPSLRMQVEERWDFIPLLCLPS